MGKITPEGMLDLLYNKKLPQVYRDEDSKLENISKGGYESCYPLKRYLESLINGGYYGSISDIEGILTLVDPMTIPKEFFPYLCESFGLTYFPDMDISYQRKFLLNIGELVKRRGTFSSVQYLTRSLTGLDLELSYFEGEYNGQDGNYLFIVLLAKNWVQLEKIDTSMGVIKSYISSQVPYYVTPIISSRLTSQIVKSKSYSFSSVGYYKHYTIQRYEEVN